jgi:monoamine oxidase
MLGECIISGANSLHEVALSECGSFQELPGVHYVIPPGFESVIHHLGKDVPKDALHLNHVVSKITYDDQGLNDEPAVCVECSNGKKFYADQCLVTISLGYLQQFACRMFDPPLPDVKMEAMRRISMGTVNKLILEFDAQILPPEVFRLEMVYTSPVPEGATLAETWVRKIPSFEAVSDNVLMGWISGKEAEYMETVPDEEVGSQCLKALRNFLGKDYPIPNLKKVTRSFWKTNPYTNGAYCHIPVGASNEDIHTIAEPITDRNGKPIVMFAGEATHPTFYSSCHGAMLSGEREAQRVLESLHQ